MIKFILSFIYIYSAFSSSSPCSLPKSQQTSLITDVISVSPPKNPQNSGQSSFSYTFEEEQSETPSVNFGIAYSNKGINQFSAAKSPFLVIQILSSETSKDGITFEVKSAETKWETLKVNLISTTRSDIELGSGSFTTSRLKNTTGEIFQISYPLQKQFSSVGLKVKPFIRSFNLQSKNKQSVGVKLADIDIEGKKVYFSFFNPEKASLVRSLTISVIAFNVQTPGILYADGIIDKNYLTSTIQVHIPKHGITELRAFIVGINSFQVSVAQEISISSALNENFTLTIGPIDRSQTSFISVSYLIFSVLQCGTCVGNPVLFEGLCKPTCPAGYVEKNGKCGQITCSKGYEIGIEGKCVPECPQNEHYLGGKCRCKLGYHSIGQKCQKCPDGTIYNQMKMTCDSVCGSNARYTNGKCVCFPGYYVFGGSRCEACPKGTIYKNNKCVTQCNQNEVFRGQACVCYEGYVKIDGVCGKCPSQTIYNSLFGRCVCLNEKTWNKEVQACVPICNENEIFVRNSCECKDGFVKIAGRCGTCPRHSYYYAQQQKCICKYGFRKVKGLCQCPYGYIYSETESRCVDRCPVNNEDWINGKCDCRKGQSRDQNGICYPPCGPFEVRVDGKCGCKKGYHKGLDGPCVPIKCPPGHSWDPQRRQCYSTCSGFNQIMVNGICTCVEGFAKQPIYKVCMPGCPSNMVRVNGKCECSPGNKRVYGVCTNCPRYSQYINGACFCYDGKLPINGQCQRLSCPDPNHFYDPISKSCKCKGPLIWIRGQCEYIRGCEENAYWSGQQCACHYGYVQQNGTCTKAEDPDIQCPANSYFDSQLYKCICDLNYYAVQEYVCRQCPPDSVWDGVKCNYFGSDCVTGFAYDGFQCAKIDPQHCKQNQIPTDGPNNTRVCKCLPGSFMIDDECQQCEYGTFFDGANCTEVETVQCDNPYKFWNGRGCVCLPNYFEFGDHCITCPQMSEWNGLGCKPIGHQGKLKVENDH